MTEQWRDVPGWPDYAVSDKGRVRGQRGWILSLCDNGSGYFRVGLHSRAGEPKRQVREYVHRLVLLGFVGGPPDGRPEAAHLNGDPSDNRLVNLRWASPSENAGHKVGHGTASIGAGNGNAVLSDGDVRTIRERLADGELHRVIAADFGVARETITIINRGKNWRHVA